MDEEKRSNQNYEIIESCTIGSTELVIGHNPNAPKAPMQWVGLMNNIRSQAEEVILTELIYK